MSPLQRCAALFGLQRYQVPPHQRKNAKREEGVRRDWTSVQMSHQQGLHFFKTVVEDGGLGELEYWLCIVENILNEDQSDISQEQPDLWSINLSREKPKHVFNSGQWRKRKRPDKDF